MRKKKSQLFNEFTILGAFVVVALTGLTVGTFSLDMDERPDAAAVAASAAPSVEDYRREAVTVAAPFLGQAAVIAGGVYPEGADSAMTDLIDLTQERLLGMTVPASERDAHLSLVILLDQWRRALGGSELDMAGVIARTEDLLTAYPWLSPL